MKPELNPKSPLNATHMVTVSLGGWTHIRYFGPNANEAESTYRVLSAGFGHTGFYKVRPVVKLWECYQTTKVLPVPKGTKDANLPTQP